MSIPINDLDHLGLVAGLIDDIGIVEIINEIAGQHKTEHVSVGMGVKGMILNGLGLVSSPLYLFSRFFEGKATSHLLRVGIEPEHLNDDRLGRILDILWEKGLSNIFMQGVRLDENDCEGAGAIAQPSNSNARTCVDTAMNHFHRCISRIKFRYCARAWRREEQCA